MPIDYKKYPPHWKELRAAVLERANNKCEFCGVGNYAVGYRDETGKFIELESKEDNTRFIGDFKTIKIVLTVAHLDHDETNHDVKIERLKALCQKCHLRLDLEHHLRNRRKNLEIKRGQIRLFE